jgi:hypothetical protein
MRIIILKTLTIINILGGLAPYIYDLSAHLKYGKDFYKMKSAEICSIPIHYLVYYIVVIAAVSAFSQVLIIGFSFMSEKYFYKKMSLKLILFIILGLSVFLWSLFDNSRII